MPKTGESCTRSGRYHGICSIGHKEPGTFDRGDTFTACSTGGCGAGPGRPASRGGHPMTWTYLGPTPTLD